MLFNTPEAVMSGGVGQCPGQTQASVLSRIHTPEGRALGIDLRGHLHLCNPVTSPGTSPGFGTILLTLIQSPTDTSWALPVCRALGTQQGRKQTQSLPGGANSLVGEMTINKLLSNQCFSGPRCQAAR